MLIQFCWIVVYVPIILIFLHQGAVIIHEVNDGGAAQRDGRLQAGDQILEVRYKKYSLILYSVL